MNPNKECLVTASSHIRKAIDSLEDYKKSGVLDDFFIDIRQLEKIEDNINATIKIKDDVGWE